MVATPWRTGQGSASLFAGFPEAAASLNSASGAQPISATRKNAGVASQDDLQAHHGGDPRYQDRHGRPSFPLGVARWGRPCDSPRRNCVHEGQPAFAGGPPGPGGAGGSRRPVFERIRRASATFSAKSAGLRPRNGVAGVDYGRRSRERVKSGILREAGEVALTAGAREETVWLPRFARANGVLHWSPPFQRGDHQPRRQ